MGNPRVPGPLWAQAKLKPHGNTVSWRDGKLLVQCAADPLIVAYDGMDRGVGRQLTPVGGRRERGLHLRRLGCVPVMAEDRALSRRAGREKVTSDQNHQSLLHW